MFMKEKKCRTLKHKPKTLGNTKNLEYLPNNIAHIHLWMFCNKNNLSNLPQ